MKLSKENLSHINTISHEGKVLLFASDNEGIIWYTVKQSGFEDSVFSAETTNGFEAWKKLPLGESTHDASTLKKFNTLLIPVFGKDQASEENPQAVKSVVAPVQLVSGMGHLHVFRQSTDNKLLVNRFILDGMKNELMPKLEVRFKRSRQKYEVSENMKMEKDTEGNAALKNVDAPDFKDMDGNPFYEPTWKLDFIDNLQQGWFSVVLLPTLENEKYRWNIFAYDSVAREVILYTLRASHSGIFDLKDYPFMQPDPKDKQKKIMRTIPGIIRRTLEIKTDGKALIPTNGLSATVYNLQKERVGDDGEMQLLKEATRVMLAVPVKQEDATSDKPNAAVLSFAAASDGTLSQLDSTPVTDPLFAKTNELILPLNTLDEVKEYIDTTPPPSGVMTGVKKSSAGTVTILPANLPQTLKSGENVKISGTKNYNGLHQVLSVIEEQDGTRSFEIAATFNNSEAGFWEVVPQKQTGLTFDNMVVSYQKAGDNRLRITCSDHNLAIGDQVQVTGTRQYDGLYPVKSVDEVNNHFTIDMDYRPGEAVDLKAKKRRGIRFTGRADYLRTGSVKLDPFAIDNDSGRTVSAWVWLDDHSGQPQLIVGQEDDGLTLSVNANNKITFTASFSDGNTHSVVEADNVPLKIWTHYAGVVDYGGEDAPYTRLYLTRNGHRVLPTADSGESLNAEGAVLVPLGPAHLQSQWLKFDGSGDYINLGNPESLRITGNQTIEMWLRPANLNNRQNPYGKCYGGEGTITLEKDGTLSYYYGTSGRTAHPYQGFTTAQSISVGKWSHIALVRNLDEQKLYWYINGEKVKEQNSNYNQAATSSRNAYIGKDYVSNFNGVIADVRVWNTARSQETIQQNRHRRLSGTEAGLMGYWPLDNGTVQDLSASNNHGTVNGNPQWQQRADKRKDHPRLFIGGNGINTHFSGKVADVQVWNQARSAQEIKDNMHLSLSGREPGLVGNWRLGAIVQEGDSRQVPDFSTNGNNARVYGSPFVSERSLKRKNAAGKKIVKYANDELVAVSQRARYRESFEFQVKNADGSPWTLDKLNNADGRNSKIFQFAYWGKASRSSEKTITFPATLYSQDEFAAVEDAAGWFRARCEFTVPDGVAMVRLFDISDVKGLWGSETTAPITEWSSIEVRKHQIEQISDAITRKAYTDAIDLATTDSSASGTLYDLWEAIRALELCEADLSRHLQNLVLRIDIVEKKDKYQKERSAKNAEKASLEEQIRNLTSRENTLTSEIRELDTSISRHTTSFDNQINALMHNYHSNITSRNNAQRAMDRYVRIFGWIIDWHGWNRHRQWRDAAASRAQSYWNQAEAARRNKDQTINNLSNQKIAKEQERSAIPAGKQPLQTQLDSINQRLELLNQFLNLTELKADLTDWQNTTEQGLTSVRNKLNMKNNEFLRTLTGNQQQPQSMQQVGIDSNQLVTQGALLTAVSPKSRLQALESARGNVELNYFDTLNNLQRTAYDATADSRNATFEQWLPNSLRSAVGFQDSADKMTFEDNKTIQLADYWTLEVWFQYPLVAQASGDTYDTQVLVEDNLGRQIVVKAGRYLGAQAGGAFFETGIDLDRAITQGWHHLAVKAEKDKNLGFYLDGKKCGTTPEKYSITFPGDNTTDCIKWSNFANFPTRAFTVSLWLKTLGRNSRATPLSYSVSDDDDLFVLYDVDPLIIYLNDSSKTTSINLDDGFWHHLAVTWKSDDGSLKVYKDGRLADQWAGLQQGYTIPGNGTLVLGHEQDSLGGGFDLSQAFDGSLRGLSIWNTARSGDDIRRDMYAIFKGNETNLIGYWPMETIRDGGKLKVRDLKTSSPQHGAIHGAPSAHMIPIIDRNNYQLKTVGNAANGGNPFGRLAELRLWQQSLSDEEIATHAKASAFSGNEPGLVAYYPMTEATGTRVRDHAAGEKTDAVLAGADWKAYTGETNKPTSDKHCGKALSFDGSDDYVEIPGLSGQLGGDEITIEYWFKGNKNQSAVRQQRNGGNAYIVVGWSATKPRHILSNDGGTGSGVSAGDIQNNQWHHVAMTWKKGASQGFISYLDGAVVSRKNAGSTALPALNASLYLGSYAGDNEFMQGQLAEVRIWNKARTQEQIIATMHRHLNGSETGLKACYPLDAFMETGGVVKVKDITTSNYHGTVHGATLVKAEDLFITGSGDKPDVLYFDGTDDRVDCGAIDLVNKSFSLECWVKNGRPGSFNLLANQGSYNTNKGLHIGFRNTNYFTFGFLRNDVDSKDAYTDQDWHHFACTYDHTNYTQTLYRDGQQVGQRTATAHYSGTGNFYLGAGSTFNPGNTHFKGSLDDIRLWNRALSQQAIQRRKNQRLSGEEPGLIGYWPVSDLVEGKLKDRSAEAKYDGVVTGARPVEASSGLPFTTVVTDFTTASVAACEYATTGLDPNNPNRKTAMLRSFRVYSTKQGDIDVLSDQRIEALELKWVGNAQFKPTLLGFIEGAPPVPSENLTVDYDYANATSVTLRESQDVSYTWNRTKDSSHGLDLDLFVGAGWGVSGGIGIETKISEGRAGFKGSLNSQFVDSNSSTVTSGSTLSFNDTLALRGEQERGTKFPYLGKRFVPKNVGYALVVSGLADMFITRLARSRRMIGYEIRPVEGVPLDINTITFQINPAYTMNGSLDGLTGSQATSERFFRHVPEMRAQYGSLYPSSYYRIREAYHLKQQIEQWDKDREAYFWNFDVTWRPGVDPSRQIADPSEQDSYGQVTIKREEDKKNTDDKDKQSATEKQNEKMDKLQGDMEKEKNKANAKAQKRKEEINKRFGDPETRERAASALDHWQSKMENLLIRSGKRNIVNTYVWDANGGLRAETQDFANTIEHTIGSNFTIGGTLGGLVDAQISAFKLELTALYAGELTQTSSKTENIGKTFGLDVDLYGMESKEISNLDGKPLKPGEKVARYRLMSFYLGGNTDNFHDFFDYVVDPEWLTGNSEGARALRQAKSAKPNKAWRVLHRVTYVERPSLEGVAVDTRPVSGEDQIAEHTVNYFDNLEKKNRAIQADLATLLKELRALRDKDTPTSGGE